MSDFPSSNLYPGGVVIGPGSWHNSIYGALVAHGISSQIITQAWTANVAVYIPFILSDWITVERCSWENGATVAGNVSVAIYDSQQNCLRDTVGSFAETHVAMSGASANQTRAFTNNILLSPGLYYLGFSSDSSTATLGTYTAAAFAGQFRGMGVFEQTTAYPLPTPTATFAVMTRLFIPSVTLFARAVA